MRCPHGSVQAAARRGRVADMAEFALPRTEEPFDFRHQAAIYARYRRDYSAGLYDAIMARTGPAAGRPPVDAGRRTGLVPPRPPGRGWAPRPPPLSRPLPAPPPAAAGR